MNLSFKHGQQFELGVFEMKALVNCGFDVTGLSLPAFLPGTGRGHLAGFRSLQMQTDRSVKRQVYRGFCLLNSPLKIQVESQGLGFRLTQEKDRPIQCSENTQIEPLTL